MRLLCICSLALLLAAAGLPAADYTASSADELRALTRELLPGDVITLADGTWKDAEVRLKLYGEKDKPITLRAREFGAHTFSGNSLLEVSGEHVVLENLVFADGWVDKGKTLIRMRGHHLRLTNSGVFYYNPPEIKTRYQWVQLDGSDNVVDHCAFVGQNHSGVTLVVELQSEEDQGRHRIANNYFGFRPRGDGNGFETMRIGASQYMTKSANVEVVDNFFEACDGEVEIISNKSCDNVYRNNLFLECEGGLTLRHGNGCTVKDNLILANHKKATGGIRVIGSGHKVLNNLVHGTEGRFDGAIALSAGQPKARDYEHQPVNDVLVQGNIVLDNKGPCLLFDHGYGEDGRTQLPREVTIQGNTFIARQGEPAIADRGQDGNTIKDNELGEMAKGRPVEQDGLPELLGGYGEFDLSLRRKQAGPAAGFEKWIR